MQASKTGSRKRYRPCDSEMAESLPNVSSSNKLFNWCNSKRVLKCVFSYMYTRSDRKQYFRKRSVLVN